MTKIFEQWWLEVPGTKTEVVTLETRDVIKKLGLPKGCRLYRTEQIIKED